MKKIAFYFFFSTFTFTLIAQENFNLQSTLNNLVSQLDKNEITSQFL